MSLDFSLWVKVIDEDNPQGELFTANYTHNVTPMWRLAGVYDALYMSKGQKAGDLVNILLMGVACMVKGSGNYIALNPPNGWGDYETALVFLRKVLAACAAHPDAIVDV